MVPGARASTLLLRAVSGDGCPSLKQGAKASYCAPQTRHSSSQVLSSPMPEIQKHFPDVKTYEQLHKLSVDEVSSTLALVIWNCSLLALCWMNSVFRWLLRCNPRQAPIVYRLIGAALIFSFLSRKQNFCWILFLDRTIQQRVMGCYFIRS